MAVPSVITPEGKEHAKNELLQLEGEAQKQGIDVRGSIEEYEREIKPKIDSGQFQREREEMRRGRNQGAEAIDPKNIDTANPPVDVNAQEVVEDVFRNLKDPLLSFFLPCWISASAIADIYKLV